MTASVRVIRPGKPSLDSDTLLVTAMGLTVIYSGQARIRVVSGSGILSVGEEQISTRSTLVSIPYDGGMPRASDVVLVDSDLEDDDLNANALTVTSVEGGGLLRVARTMTCTEYTGNQWWRP